MVTQTRSRAAGNIAFLAGRAEQIKLLAQFGSTAWEATRKAAWGEVTLRWLVTKTYQHTAEHTHDVLRMALFWGGHPAPLRQIE